MEELLIKKQKYVQIPLEISKLEKSPQTVKKLSLHLCSNSNIQITDEWSSLEYIEIIGCRYLELSFAFKQPSQLKQIFFASTDYVDILDFSGSFPFFSKWRFESCRYVKFKGTFTGDNHLQSLEFNDSPNCEVFKNPTNLPYLNSIEYLDGCNFTKLDLNLLTAPKLHRLWFRNSNYVNIVSLGKIEEQLQSFKFENCAYPKLNLDFSRLARLTHENQPTELDSKVSADSPEEESSPFRKFKRQPRPKRTTTKRNIRNDPDMVLMRETLSSEDPTLSAQNFLNSPSSVLNDNNNDKENLPAYDPTQFMNSLKQLNDSPSKTSPTVPESPKFKFCPECGSQNPLGAGFCSSCGFKLQNR
ncbi:hypothetical protein NEF87_003052 [Candidatus Lokiarchaeum ossiferum]|uniref:Zinc-ribbon domain-containing protein n=1 Tax=Candidatus Lokiarchaeum ossiferum TaxID=2951803 RepID=A0ABY6HV73_9ARCH|nr:hypothetical protein NEF87_003052 [Candidatus Lokiarchaeum sp. B-35]